MSEINGSAIRQLFFPVLVVGVVAAVVVVVVALLLRAWVLPFRPYPGSPYFGSNTLKPLSQFPKSINP